MRRTTSALLLSALLSTTVPGVLLVSAGTSAAAPTPVAPGVVELSVSGVDPAAAADPTDRALVTDGTSRRTVLLTSRQATADYGLVGVTWRPDRAVGAVEAFARTREDGLWSDWTLIGGAADEAPDDDQLEARDGVRTGTTPLWVGQADGVQVRVDVLSGADPQDVRVALVDPGTSAADATAAQPVSATGQAALRVAGAPAIRSRAEWGADESLRTGSPSYASSVKAVVVHHTASSNDYAPSDVPRLLRGFYAYHVKSQGWSDIGYNLLVDRFGTVWEGRAGGTDRAVIGAHAGGFNTGTVGISMVGTFESVAPPSAQLEAVAQASAWRLSSAGVDPKGTVQITSGGGTKWSAGTVVTLPTVMGHRQVSSTSCPGTKGYAALPALRDRTAALTAGAAPTAGGLQLIAPTSAAAESVVELSVRGGQPGATVEVFFTRRGELGATRRREGVLSELGTYRTTYVANDDYTVFAVSGGTASVPTTVRRTPALTTLAASPAPVVTATGPVTTVLGGTVLVTATGPAGAAVSVWFRGEGDERFVRRREGRFGADGRYTTTYLNARPHDYFARTTAAASAVASTAVGAVPDGLHVFAPDTSVPGRTVPLVVQGTPGQPVQVWFSRGSDPAYTVRREGVLAADGTFRTSYVAADEHTFFATSGTRSSTRRTTRLTAAPTQVVPPTLPRVGLSAPPTIDAGDPVELVVSGQPGAAVQVWARRRGATTWTRARVGVFDAAGRYRTSYAGVDDHLLWAASAGSSSPDRETLTLPVLTGPSSSALGAKVVLAGRARPGDAVVVESRRRLDNTVVRTVQTADGAGAFLTSYAVDDEYEHRPLVGTRVGSPSTTTVAPTVTAPSSAVLGSVVTLTGTARPGATVEVWFQRDGQPSTAIGSRRARDLPAYVLGQTVTADTAGRYRAGFVLTRAQSWVVVSDGNPTGIRTTTVR